MKQLGVFLCAVSPDHGTVEVVVVAAAAVVVAAVVKTNFLILKLFDLQKLYKSKVADI